MEAADLHRMSPTMISSLPPKRSARHSKAKLSARKIRIPNARWPGCPGSLPVSADGIATTSRPVQRPCERAGPSSPTGPRVIVLQWLSKMCESRSLRGEGRGEGPSPRIQLAESPPHPKFAVANFDLSPQAGRSVPSQPSRPIQTKVIPHKCPNPTSPKDITAHRRELRFPDESPSQSLFVALVSCVKVMCLNSRNTAQIHLKYPERPLPRSPDRATEQVSSLGLARGRGEGSRMPQIHVLSVQDWEVV